MSSEQNHHTLTRVEYELPRSMPKNAFGFRGEPYRFATQTLQHGFNGNREYFVFHPKQYKADNFKESLWHYFNFSAGCSMTLDNLKEGIRAQEAMAYFQIHPEHYASVLLLSFNDISALRYVWNPSKREFLDRPVPSKYIQKIITLTSEDMQKADRLFHPRLNPDFHNLHSILEPLLFQRFLEAVSQL